MLQPHRQPKTDGSLLQHSLQYGMVCLETASTRQERQKQSPTVEADGVFFGDYKEGVPGVQPERVGPYCTTFNPGYDPTLPLYQEWPMYSALRAANAPGQPAWSPYAVIDKQQYDHRKTTTPSKKYKGSHLYR